AVAPGGKVIATAARDHSIRLWDADTGRELRRLGWTPTGKRRIDTHSAVDDLIFSPDGKLLAAAGYEYKVWLWDLEKGNVARTFPGIAAAFPADGKPGAGAEGGGGARLYETATGKEVRQFKGHLSGIKHLLFTPDGQTLVTASFGRREGSLGGRVKEWDR